MMRFAWRRTRHWVGMAAATAALVSLAACAGGTQISRLPTPPDPAPIPKRKPLVPAEFASIRPDAPAARIVSAPSSTITATALPLPRRNPRQSNVGSTRQTAAQTAAQPQPVPTPSPKPPAAAPPANPTAVPVPQAQPAINPVATSATSRYVVSAGENVFSIARKLNVPIRSLLEVNRLGPPYKLAAGQRLIVPIPTRHIVTRGDTVYGISRRYRIDIRSLVQLNRIPPPYRISVGQVLNLPGSNNAFDAATPQVAAANARQSVSQSQGSLPQTTRQDNATAPNQAGSTSPTAPSASASLPVPAAKPAQTARPAPKPAPNTPAQAKAAPAQTARIAPPKPGPRPPAGVPKPPPRSSGKFGWPLQGRILSSFGSKGGGVHNDGINIESPAGSTVRAAENGVIAYSGNELRGFGRLLLIRHADGWVTAYAHLGEVLVSRGLTVKRGQPIAKVGRTGNVSRPQLHFEIRQGTRAVDPRKLLGKQQARR